MSTMPMLTSAEPVSQMQQEINTRPLQSAASNGSTNITPADSFPEGPTLAGTSMNNTGGGYSGGGSSGGGNTGGGY